MVTGWKRSTVKDISTIFGRIGFRGYTKDDIVEAYEGAISLSPSNLKDGKIDVSNSTFISWHKYNESPEIKLKNGDVVLVKTGSTYGKSAYVDNLKWATTLNPQIVVFKNIKLNNKLFAYFVQTPEFQKQIEATIVGGAIPTLSQNQVYQFEIIFPIDEEEQNRIAEALSDMDSMISSLEKLIAKKKAVKQGAMQELLTGKKRLPGFNQHWSKVKLSDIFDFYKGNGLSKEKITVDGKSPCILYGELFTRYFEVIYEVKNNTNYDEGFLSRSFDVLMPGSTTTNGLDLATASVIMQDNVLLGGDIVVLRSKKQMDTRIFGYLFRMMEREILLHTQGITIVHLNTKTLRDLEVLIPSTVEEQTAIASILSDMDNEIEALEQKLEKTRQLKQGMMQQLLTGKIRLV